MILLARNIAEMLLNIEVRKKFFGEDPKLTKHKIKNGIPSN
jgi:hypothetical protein